MKTDPKNTQTHPPRDIWDIFRHTIRKTDLEVGTLLSVVVGAQAVPWLMHRYIHINTSRSTAQKCYCRSYNSKGKLDFSRETCP